MELDEREDGNAIRYELSQMTGRTSVPQIWIDGEFVGGCNDGERSDPLLLKRVLFIARLARCAAPRVACLALVLCGSRS